jgi:hypothetical protein
MGFVRKKNKSTYFTEHHIQGARVGEGKKAPLKIFATFLLRELINIC